MPDHNINPKGAFISPESLERPAEMAGRSALRSDNIDTIIQDGKMVRMDTAKKLNWYIWLGMAVGFLGMKAGLFIISINTISIIILII